jgi:hypothetical protein
VCSAVKRRQIAPARDQTARQVAESARKLSRKLASRWGHLHRRERWWTRCTPSEAAKAEALRTGPDAFLRNEANFAGVGEAELRARKPVTKLREILAGFAGEAERIADIARRFGGAYFLASEQACGWRTIPRC